MANFYSVGTIKANNVTSQSGAGITFLDNQTQTGRTITGGTFTSTTLTAPTLNGGTVPTGNKLTLTDLPVSGTDAANKTYVDARFSGGGLFANTSTAGVLSADNIELQTTVGSGVVQRQEAQCYVTTTAGTNTTIGTVACATSGSNTYIKASINAHRTGGTAGTADDSGMFVLEGTFKNSGGTVTFPGTPGFLQAQSDQAAWTVLFTISGTNVNIQVSGATNNNISWYGTVTYMAASV